MLRCCFQLLLTIGLVSALAVSQERPGETDVARYSAPVRWQLYKVSASDASFMMPKLPVKNDLFYECSEKLASTYHSYADESLYEFRYYRKGPMPINCVQRQYFERDALERRLNELRTAYKPPPVSETDGDVNGRKVKIFRWETERERAMRWVFVDIAKTSWVELAINHRLDAKPEVKTFLDSLELRSTIGTEVLMGSPTTMGDRGAVKKQPISASASGSLREPLLILSKPRPGYTEAARNNLIAGKIILNVAFLANGGIGEISVVEGLAHGLNEAAIAAARRIAFLPARENGVPLTIVRKIEYTFSIF